ncbi:hypothetical protein B484DRAFT_398983, partial [Ochromonadaceae sp. CCMP2298]
MQPNHASRRSIEDSLDDIVTAADDSLAQLERIKSSGMRPHWASTPGSYASQSGGRDPGFGGGHSGGYGRLATPEGDFSRLSTVLARDMPLSRRSTTTEEDVVNEMAEVRAEKAARAERRAELMAKKQRSLDERMRRLEQCVAASEAREGVARAEAVAAAEAQRGDRRVITSLRSQLSALKATVEVLHQGRAQGQGQGQGYGAVGLGSGSGIPPLPFPSAPPLPAEDAVSDADADAGAEIDADADPFTLGAPLPCASPYVQSRQSAPQSAQSVPGSASLSVASMSEAVAEAVQLQLGRSLEHILRVRDRQGAVRSAPSSSERELVRLAGEVERLRGRQGAVESTCHSLREDIRSRETPVQMQAQVAQVQETQRRAQRKELETQKREVEAFLAAAGRTLSDALGATKQNTRDVEAIRGELALLVDNSGGMFAELDERLAAAEEGAEGMQADEGAVRAEVHALRGEVGGAARRTQQVEGDVQSLRAQLAEQSRNVAARLGAVEPRILGLAQSIDAINSKFELRTDALMTGAEQQAAQLQECRQMQMQVRDLQGAQAGVREEVRLLAESVRARGGPVPDPSSSVSTPAPAQVPLLGTQFAQVRVLVASLRAELTAAQERESTRLAEAIATATNAAANIATAAAAAAAAATAAAAVALEETADLRAELASLRAQVILHADAASARDALLRRVERRIREANEQHRGMEGTFLSLARHLARLEGEGDAGGEVEQRRPSPIPSPSTVDYSVDPFEEEGEAEEVEAVWQEEDGGTEDGRTEDGGTEDGGTENGTEYEGTDG